MTTSPPAASRAGWIGSSAKFVDVGGTEYGSYVTAVTMEPACGNCSTSVFRLGHPFKVFHAIVCLVTIFVVDDGLFRERRR